MDVALIPLKIKQRLNKLDSSDYDNIECWMFVEAYNKAQLQYCRRALKRAESNKQILDDYQILLTELPLKGINKDTFFEVKSLPTNYLSYSRISAKAKKDSCTDKKIKVYLVEEANLDMYLTDFNKRPSLEWGETLSTFLGNKTRIYTDGKFLIQEATLTYYRKPREISVLGCEDIKGNQTGNINPELKDDVVELIIDEATAILAGDIESFNQLQREQNNVAQNT